jgi:hypothetical protein
LTFPVLFRRAAELDVATIEDWYEGQHWYRALETSVVVLACVHGARDPRALRTRLRSDR